MALGETVQWCTDRGHPFITYDPSGDRSYCRCGQQQEQGDKPMDWQAKRDVFHSCQPDEPCRCYVSGTKAPQ
ncbi:hypothetical protein ABZ953_06855 [Streptomyces sp. NPDC046465]|uniref:hypothetical protein n=1 Tax=Streptomyces sp. NPDC046465 TaxID=3155810 RepID=UPI0033EB4DE7